MGILLLEKSWGAALVSMISFGLVLFVLSGLSVNFVYTLVLIPSLLYWFKEKSKISVDGYLWGGYLVYVLISSLWSENQFDVFLDGARYLFYLALFLHALYIFKKEGYKPTYVLVGAVSSVVFVELFSIISYVESHGFDVWVDRFPRIYGKIGVESPIDLSCIMVLCILALLANSKVKPMCFIFVFFAAAILIAPFQTRISLLGLGVGVFVILFQRKFYKTMAASILVAVLVFLFFYFGVDRFSSNRYPRLDIWLFSLNKVVDECSLFYGCGLGYDFDINVSGKHYAQHHSLVFSQFFYGGALGFLAFAILILRTLWVLFKRKSYWFSVFVFSLVILMTNRHEIISNPDFVWVMLWLPLGFSGILFKSEVVEEDGVEPTCCGVTRDTRDGPIAL